MPSTAASSLQDPVLTKKIRNAKQLSLMVTPTPGNTSFGNTNLGHHTANKSCAKVIASSLSSLPSTKSSSLSSRRPFTPAPLSSSAVNIQITSCSTTSKRRSQLLLDDALPTPRLPLSSNSHGPKTSTLAPTRNLSLNNNPHRSISAYFSDYSLECGVATPYTSGPVCVLPNLYLGAEHNATDIPTLMRLGITLVLNVAVEIASDSYTEGSLAPLPTNANTVERLDQSSTLVQYRSLAWTHHQKSLLQDFPKAFALMDEAIALNNNQGKVLVHCQLGVSRSASLVIAYVMRSQRMGLNEAYDFVKERSAVISPNMSLMYQLAEFEKSLKSSSVLESRPTASDNSAWYMSRDENEYGDEDEPPYPFYHATPVTSVPTSASISTPMPSYQEPSYKRPLTPEMSADDFPPPTPKPFQSTFASRMRGMSTSRATRYRRSLSTSSVISTSSTATFGSTSTFVSAVASIAPTTPTIERLSPFHGLDINGPEMHPVTPLFQTSFVVPSLSASSSTTTLSSASSVVSFEGCSRPCSVSTCASFLTATVAFDDESSDMSGEEETRPRSNRSIRSPRSSGMWSSSSLSSSSTTTAAPLSFPSPPPSIAPSASSSPSGPLSKASFVSEAKASSSTSRSTLSPSQATSSSISLPDFIFSPRSYTPARSFGGFFHTILHGEKTDTPTRLWRSKKKKQV
ncbi:hypothetical protein BGW38_000623 [Lunasporangiospora selenospora]|uniref:protein-tyrosine-phosphatase n=1 Tax=Lunasporangiospora selenospora TaxID=979761 RepID=A0A9P6KEP7_9FUNG|nr:hypothetical protein BGW38_000623 [Lunasporangiospora selenospora]